MTGYGPTVPDQAHAAATAQAAGFDDITLLGAHTAPPEYARDPMGTWTWYQWIPGRPTGSLPPRSMFPQARRSCRHSAMATGEVPLP